MSMRILKASSFASGFRGERFPVKWPAMAGLGMTIKPKTPARKSDQGA